MLKVGPDGTATTLVHPVAVADCEVVLKAERPWSPTGVAVHGGDVYVLEYTNANGGMADGWTPRVRKLARDGKVTNLATVSPRSKP